MDNKIFPVDDNLKNLYWILRNVLYGIHEPWFMDHGKYQRLKYNDLNYCKIYLKTGLSHLN